MTIAGATSVRWFPNVHEDRVTTFGVRIRLMEESPL